MENKGNETPQKGEEEDKKVVAASVSDPAEATSPSAFPPPKVCRFNFCWVKDHQHLFNHLAIYAGTIVGILALFIFLFSFAGAKWEHHFFPSSRHIEPLQKKVHLAEEKIEDLKRQLQSHQSQLETQKDLGQKYATLSDTVSSLSKAVDALNSKGEEGLSPHPSSQSEAQSLVADFSAVQERFSKGEAFSDILEKMAPSLAGQKILLDSLEMLKDCAKTSTKPIELLRKELQTLCDHLKKEASSENQGNVPQKKGLVERIIEKVSSLFRIRKVGKIDLPQKNVQIVLPIIEKSLQILDQGEIQSALSLMQPLSVQYPSLFGDWMQDAEKRHELEEAFSLFKAHFEIFLKGE